MPRRGNVFTARKTLPRRGTARRRRRVFPFWSRARARSLPPRETLPRRAMARGNVTTSGHVARRGNVFDRVHAMAGGAGKNVTTSRYAHARERVVRPLEAQEVASRGPGGLRGGGGGWLDVVTFCAGSEALERVLRFLEAPE